MATKKTLRIKLLKTMYTQAEAMVKLDDCNFEAVSLLLKSLEDLERLHADLALVGIREQKYNLQELVDKITPENQHDNDVVEYEECEGEADETYTEEV